LQLLPEDVSPTDVSVLPIYYQIVPKLSVSTFSEARRQVTNIIATRFNIISSSTIQSVESKINLNIRKIITDAIHLYPLPTVNDIGAFLEIDLNETEDIIYITDTRNFPDSGRLLVGKEIVTYQSKLTDRFLDVQRGTFNTVATTHSAGDYLRNLPDFTSVVSAPVTTITCESVVSTVSTQPSQVSRITSSFDQVNNNVTILTSESELKMELDIIVDATIIDIPKQITVTRPFFGNSGDQVEYEGTEVLNQVQVNDEVTFISHQSELKLDLNVLRLVKLEFIKKEIISYVKCFSIAGYNLHLQDRKVSNNLNIEDKVKIILTESEIKLDLNVLTNPSIVSTSNQTTINYGNKNEVVRSISFVTSYEKTEIVDLININAITTISSTLTNITKLVKTGFIDYPASTEEIYELDKAGSTIGNYEFVEFYDLGVSDASIDDQVLGTFDLRYPFMTIEDFEVRKNSNFALSGDRFDSVVPSINEYATELSSDLLLSETSIISVVGTSGFPSSGKLYVGNEIISYTGKTSTTFTGLSRGQNGTNAQNWTSGQYIRSTN